MAIREGRIVKEVIYTLKQAGKGKRQARSEMNVWSKQVGSISESLGKGYLSRSVVEIVEYQNPPLRRQKGLGNEHPGVLKRKCF